MNTDRVIAITGILIGILGIVVGIYVTKPHNYETLFIVSGWATAFIIALMLSASAIITIARLERELIKSKNDQIEMQYDLVQFQNISQALASAVVKPSSRSRRRPNITQQKLKEDL